MAFLTTLTGLKELIFGKKVMYEKLALLLLYIGLSGFAALIALSIGIK